MTPPLLYAVRFTDTYIHALSIIKRYDRRVALDVHQTAEDLALFPDKKGKPLVGQLSRLWSRRACGQRYRIIYRFDNEALTVDVIFVGIRKEGSKKDVYRAVRSALK